MDDESLKRAHVAVAKPFSSPGQGTTTVVVPSKSKPGPVSSAQSTPSPKKSSKKKKKKSKHEKKQRHSPPPPSPPIQVESTVQEKEKTTTERNDMVLSALFSERRPTLALVTPYSPKVEENEREATPSPPHRPNTFQDEEEMELEKEVAEVDDVKGQEAADEDEREVECILPHDVADLEEMESAADVESRVKELERESDAEAEVLVLQSESSVEKKVEKEEIEHIVEPVDTESVVNNRTVSPATEIAELCKDRDFTVTLVEDEQAKDHNELELEDTVYPPTSPISSTPSDHYDPSGDLDDEEEGASTKASPDAMDVDEESAWNDVGVEDEPFQESEGHEMEQTLEENLPSRQKEPDTIESVCDDEISHLKVQEIAGEEEMRKQQEIVNAEVEPVEKCTVAVEDTKDSTADEKQKAEEVVEEIDQDESKEIAPLSLPSSPLPVDNPSSPQPPSEPQSPETMDSSSRDHKMTCPSTPSPPPPIAHAAVALDLDEHEKPEEPATLESVCEDVITEEPKTDDGEMDEVDDETAAVNAECMATSLTSGPLASMSSSPSPRNSPVAELDKVKDTSEDDTTELLLSPKQNEEFTHASVDKETALENTCEKDSDSDSIAEALRDAVDCLEKQVEASEQADALQIPADETTLVEEKEDLQSYSTVPEADVVLKEKEGQDELEPGELVSPPTSPICTTHPEYGVDMADVEEEEGEEGLEMRTSHDKMVVEEEEKDLQRYSTVPEGQDELELEPGEIVSPPTSPLSSTLFDYSAKSVEDESKLDLMTDSCMDDPTDLITLPLEIPPSEEEVAAESENEGDSGSINEAVRDTVECLEDQVEAQDDDEGSSHSPLVEKEKSPERTPEICEEVKIVVKDSQGLRRTGRSIVERMYESEGEDDDDEGRLYIDESYVSHSEGDEDLPPKVPLDIPDVPREPKCSTPTTSTINSSPKPIVTTASLAPRTISSLLISASPYLPPKVTNMFTISDKLPRTTAALAPTAVSTSIKPTPTTSTVASSPVKTFSPLPEREPCLQLVSSISKPEIRVPVESAHASATNLPQSHIPPPLAMRVEAATSPIKVASPAPLEKVPSPANKSVQPVAQRESPPMVPQEQIPEEIPQPPPLPPPQQISPGVTRAPSSSSSCAVVTTVQPVNGSILYNFNAAEKQYQSQAVASMPDYVPTQVQFMLPEGYPVPTTMQEQQYVSLPTVTSTPSQQLAYDPSSLYFIQSDGQQALEGNYQLVYAVATARAEPNDGAEDGPPTKVRLVHAEALGVGQNGNELQFYYASTTPDQHVQPTNPQVQLIEPVRVMYNQETNEATSEMLRYQVQPPQLSPQVLNLSTQQQQQQQYQLPNAQTYYQRTIAGHVEEQNGRSPGQTVESLGNVTVASATQESSVGVCGPQDLSGRYLEHRVRVKSNQSSVVASVYSDDPERHTWINKARDVGHMFPQGALQYSNNIFREQRSTACRSIPSSTVTSSNMTYTNGRPQSHHSSSHGNHSSSGGDVGNGKPMLGLDLLTGLASERLTAMQYEALCTERAAFAIAQVGEMARRKRLKQPAPHNHHVQQQQPVQQQQQVAPDHLQPPFPQQQVPRRVWDSSTQLSVLDWQVVRYEEVRTERLSSSAAESEEEDEAEE